MPTTAQLTLAEALKKATHEHLHGDKALALKLYVQILQHDKNNVPAMVQLGFLKLEEGKPMVALGHAARAADLEPKFLKAYHLAMFAITKARPLKDARAWCQKGLAQFPADAPLLFFAAQIAHLVDADTPQAIDLCQKALTSDPHHRPSQQLLSALNDARRRAA